MHSLNVCILHIFHAFIEWVLEGRLRLSTLEHLIQRRKLKPIHRTGLILMLLVISGMMSWEEWFLAARTTRWMNVSLNSCLVSKFLSPLFFAFWTNRSFPPYNVPLLQKKNHHPHETINCHCHISSCFFGTLIYATSAFHATSCLIGMDWLAVFVHRFAFRPFHICEEC